MQRHRQWLTIFCRLISNLDSKEQLKIKFDKMTSHDITFVGIIQTARARDLRNSRFRMY